MAPSVTNVKETLTQSRCALPKMKIVISVGKRGHYQRMCRAGKAAHGIEEEDEDCFFLSSVSNDTSPWTEDIDILDKTI